VKETDLTVVGNVVNAPQRSRLANGASVTNFRMASTSRRFDRETQSWTDHRTLFVDVECWGELGGNVSHSISKGDPVVVVGAIRTHEWESEQGRRSRPQIKAEAVAPNLARGVADFRRTPRPAAAVPEESGPSGDGQEFPASVEDLVAGRDYVGDGETLDGVNPADLSAEPAHV
jgi:single-strand DNA-binding protein